MKMMKTMLALLLALALLPFGALAEEVAVSTEVAAIVNGEEILEATLDSLIDSYTTAFQTYGMDTTREDVQAYIADVALTELIEAVLIEQDMKANGFYEFSAQEQAKFHELAQAEYDAFVEEAEAYYIEWMGEAADEDTASNAEAFGILMAQQYGVDVEYLAQLYLGDQATENYRNSLIEGLSFTDEQVVEQYNAYVADSKAAYENDVEAYETAIYYNQNIWFAPAGYRSVLQILINLDDEGNLATLESVKGEISDIYARLEAGESFASLIAEYGDDTAFDDPAFYETGYQVHKESFMWDPVFVEAAFSEKMVKPGDYSEAFESPYGVHILYYLNDIEGGAVPLTDEVKLVVQTLMREQAISDAMTARVNALSEAATVEIIPAAE